MNDPIIIFSADAPVEVREGSDGALYWKRLLSGFDLMGDWESFEYARLDPGGRVPEHVHDRTEEIYFITKGHASIVLDDSSYEIGPGDLILTPLGGKHGATPSGDEGLEFIVTEILPPEVLEPGTASGRARKSHIISLAEPGSVDPKPYFDGPWRSIAYERVTPGTNLVLDATDVEHAIYVVLGRGWARSRSLQVPLGPRRGLALPIGGHVALEADEPMEFLRVTVNVERRP